MRRKRKEVDTVVDAEQKLAGLLNLSLNFLQLLITNFFIPDA